MPINIAALISGGTATLKSLLAEYGIWTYIGASFVKGLGIYFLGPAELVTPAYVLLRAQNPFHVASIVVIGAAALTLGTIPPYIIFRLLGNRFISPEQRQTSKWRFLSWAVGNHARTTLILGRMIPVIGGFITVPVAAIVRIPFRTFLIYTFIGAVLYEGLLGFATYYGIKHGLFLQTEIGRTVMFTMNTTLGIPVPAP